MLHLFTVTSFQCSQPLVRVRWTGKSRALSSDSAVTSQQWSYTVTMQLQTSQLIPCSSWTPLYHCYTTRPWDTSFLHLRQRLTPNLKMAIYHFLVENHSLRHGGPDPHSYHFTTATLLILNVIGGKSLNQLFCFIK